MPRPTPSPSAAPGLRTPPHSAEAERGVLGSILLDVGNDNRVLDLCTENGITEEAAKAVITLIATGKVPRIQIHY